MLSGPATVNTSQDKGMRFTFPNGINGDSNQATPVRCQAHENHWVAPDSDGSGVAYLNTNSDNNEYLIVEEKTDNNQVMIALSTVGENGKYIGRNLMCKSTFLAV